MLFHCPDCDELVDLSICRSERNEFLVMYSCEHSRLFRSAADVAEYMENQHGSEECWKNHASEFSEQEVSDRPMLSNDYWYSKTY